MPRLIIANLDAEQDIAEANTPGPHKKIPLRVRRALSVASTSLRVFARSGDHIWTMEELDAPPPSDLARATATDKDIKWLTGTRLSLENYSEVLYWSQWRPNAPTTGQASDTSLSPESPLPQKPHVPGRWQEKLWKLHSGNEATCIANDRRSIAKLRCDDDWNDFPMHPSSMEELDLFLAKANLGPDDAWVAKAPFSAAGRERVRRRGRILDGEIRVRCQRLMQRYGCLVLEAWVDRIADFGSCGLVTEDSFELFPTHKLVVEAGGGFRGIYIDDALVAQQLGQEHERLQRTNCAVARYLHSIHYRGPFAIDSYLYRDSEGRTALRSLCEINARLSFGHIARARLEGHKTNSYLFEI